MHFLSPGRTTDICCPTQQDDSKSTGVASSRPHGASPRADDARLIKSEVGSDTLHLSAVSTYGSSTSTPSTPSNEGGNVCRRELATQSLASSDAHDNAIKSEYDTLTPTSSDEDGPAKRGLTSPDAHDNAIKSETTDDEDVENDTLTPTSNDEDGPAKQGLASPDAHGNAIKSETEDEDVENDTLTPTSSDEDGPAKRGLVSPDAHDNAIKSETDDEDVNIATLKAKVAESTKDFKPVGWRQEVRCHPCSFGGTNFVAYIQLTLLSTEVTRPRQARQMGHARR